MAWDAFHLLVPDIFVDTMGYAFALGLSRLLFRRAPTCAYVHYPTISTDMLESLDPSSPLGSKGVNAGQGTGLRGFAKRWYWRLFAALYVRTGATVDSVMTNSSWTQAHIQKLWGARRRHKPLPITVNYPPVAVTELESKIELSPTSEAKREKILLLIAQFRPEKDHQHIIQSFARFAKSGTEASRGARLVLVGSVRDDADSKRVYQLRLLVNELNVKDRVEFHLDASWPEVLEWLRRASVGVNGMWNEHFGIGVVEYQAAGLVSVVHASGGPKMDIVVDIDGGPTGKALLALLSPSHSATQKKSRTNRRQASTQTRQTSSLAPSKRPSRCPTRSPCGGGRACRRGGSPRRSLQRSGRSRWRRWSGCSSSSSLCVSGRVALRFPSNSQLRSSASRHVSFRLLLSFEFCDLYDSPTAHAPLMSAGGMGL